jgi:hypothetical protein
MIIQFLNLHLFLWSYKEREWNFSMSKMLPGKQHGLLQNGYFEDLEARTVNNCHGKSYFFNELTSTVSIAWIRRTDTGVPKSDSFVLPWLYVRWKNYLVIPASEIALSKMGRKWGWPNKYIMLGTWHSVRKMAQWMPHIQWLNPNKNEEKS